MYESFYNLTEKPFQINPDPRFLWFGEKHREAMANLKYGLLDQNGFIVLTGDVGTGKTTLVNALLASLDKKVRIVKVNHPSLEIKEFLSLVAKSLDPDVETSDKSDLLLFFNRFLQKAHADGEVVLLIIDEAHRLSVELLEEIRLLSNIELTGQKLLSIILVGQNEIKPILKLPQCRAVWHRITSLFEIEVLTKEETRQYIDYRLNLCGADGPLFRSEAIDEIYAISQGNPRLINVLCDRALLTGYVKEHRVIDADIVTECGQELELGDSVKGEAQIGIASKTTALWRMLSAWQLTTRATIVKIVGAIYKRGRRNWHTSLAWLRSLSERVFDFSITRALHFVQRYRKKFLPAILATGGIVILVSATTGLYIATKVQERAATGPMAPKITEPVATPQSRQGSQKEQVAKPELKPAQHSATAPSAPMVASHNDDAASGQASLSDKLVDTPKVPLATSKTPVESVIFELEQKNHLGAIELIETYQNPSPDEKIMLAGLYAKALVGRAREIMLASPSEAEALLRKAADVDPQQTDALLLLGRWNTRLKRYDRAIDAYERVIRNEPYASDALFNLGFLYATTGKFEAAEKSFQQVVLLKPPYLDKARFNLAVVQQQLGKSKASIANLKAVVVMEPENEKALAYLNQLQSTAVAGKRR